MKLTSDNLAFFLALSWIFIYESAGSPYLGFYAIPGILAIFLYFHLPFISRELNTFLSFGGGIFFASTLNFKPIFFVSPFFLILSLILYVFAKK